jgi:hypothetical protein
MDTKLTLDPRRILEAERARAFEEAREVSEEYGKFLETIDQ